MSSRQEEKARRRKEREEQERAAAKGAARIKRLQLAVGAVLALAVIVAVVVAITSSGGSSSDSAAKPSGKAHVPPPGANAKNLTAAARAAGCKLLNPASEGQTHTDKVVTYKSSNPPASGPHNPVAAQDGLYAPGNEPAKESWVHMLEHGRVLIQYRPGSTKALVDQMETVGSENDGYHVGVMENNTKMPYQVAAIAWTHVLGCPSMNPRVFDAIRAFRDQYTDQGPERIP